MKTYFNFFPFLLVLAALSSGCPGNDPPERPFVELPAEFKSYCYFQAGSYWIYQNDSIASFQDSAYVFTSECKDQYDLDRTSFDFEECFYELVYLGEPWTEDLYPESEVDPGGPFLYHFVDFQQPGILKKAYHLFDDDLDLDSMRIGDANTYITGRYDTLSIGGIEYQDVIRVTHTASTFGNPIRELHWAKGVGIVKRLHWDGSSWTLLRHSVLQ